MVPDVGLIVFPWYPSLETGRGHDTYTYHLLKHLLNMKLNVKVLPLLSVKGLQEGVNKFDFVAKEALFLTKMLRTKTRIYHGISPIGSKTAVLAKKHPLVTTIHDIIPFVYQRNIKQTYERLCIKLCCDSSDKIIVTSEFTRSYLRNKLHVHRHKIEVIKCGVDHSFFFPRERLNRDGKVLFSIVRWADLKQFLCTFKMVTKEVKNVKLLLGLKSSGGRYKEQIPYLLNKLGLRSSIEIHNDIPISRLPDYYNIADAYVSVSMGGFSLTLLEAMACGTPVIAFDLLDVPEYVEEGGVLVKPGDYQELAEAILRILTDEQLSDKLREKAIKRAEIFSWEKMAKETVNVYKSLI